MKIGEAKLKVAFIQRNSEFSLGSAYIASAISDLAESRVFIACYEEDLLDAVIEYNPDVLAFSTFTAEYKQLLDLNKEIKQRIKVFSVFGGPHPTHNPDFINNDGVDAMCRGEGEESMLELIDALKNSREFLGINNFYFKKEDGSVVKNDLRELSRDIDRLRFPDRDIYSEYFYLEDFKNNVAKRVITGRGCPFNCTYCYNHSLKKIYHQRGPYLRIRSVKNVIDELSFLKGKYNVPDFDFVDDIFGIKPGWLEEFSAKYEKLIGLPFSCLAHVRVIDKNYVTHLKKAGCEKVSIGLETANESYRQKVLKRDYTNNELIAKTDILHEMNIPFITFNILLLPGETIKMALETLKLNLKCKPFYAWTAIYQPYPGTELANYAFENGFLSRGYEVVPENFFVSSSLKNKQKGAMMRLFYLFSFTVEFSWLYPFTRVIIYLPLGGIYKKIFKHFKDVMRDHYLFNRDRLNERILFFEFLFGLIIPKKRDNFLSYRPHTNK